MYYPLSRDRFSPRTVETGSDDHRWRLECKNGRRGRDDKRGPKGKQTIKTQDNKHGRKNTAKISGRESLDDNQW